MKHAVISFPNLSVLLLKFGKTHFARLELPGKRNFKEISLTRKANTITALLGPNLSENRNKSLGKRF